MFLHPKTGHFACYAFKARISDEINSTQEISPGFYVSNKAPFTIDDFWKDALGTIKTRYLEDCNLFIFAVSEHSFVSERHLLSEVDTCWFALLLQGLGYNYGGMTMGGENTSEGMHVRAHGDMELFHEPPKVLPDDLTMEAFIKSIEIGKGLRTIYANQTKDDYLRLRKGFNAFLEGIKQAQWHERLHHFVRAIEATIRPKQGEGTGKFKYRGQFFAGRKPEAQKILGELYEMRSAAEHLNPLKDKLSDYPGEDRKNLIALRTYQAELLASFIYRKILTNAEYLSSYISEDSITALWSEDTKNLINFWGNSIDLEREANIRFFDYL